MRSLGFIISMVAPLIATAGTLHVNPSNPAASDRNAGNSESPFKTISHAAAVARAGDTVLISGGIYPESIETRVSGTADKPIRFVAAPGQTVIVTGADSVRDWKPVDDTPGVYFVPWDHVFEIDRHNGVPVEHHPADAPLWGRAEQVMCESKQLLPVATLAELRELAQRKPREVAAPLPNLGGPFAGWFFADTVRHRLYVALADGRDPNERLMRASTRGQLFGVNPWKSKSGVEHVHVSGIVFQYAANFPQRPAVWLHGRNNLVEDCEIVDMSGSGILVNGTMRNCRISRNGHTGGSAIGENFLNQTCFWDGNSWKPINRQWEAGGAKVALSQDGSFRNCVFIRNGGPGLWLDIDVRDVTIDACKFLENEKSGLMIEISRDISVSGCTFSQNGIGAVGRREDDDWGAAGILLAESRSCTVRNNELTENRNGISIREIGPRTTASIEGPDVEYRTSGHRISDNTITNNSEYQLAFWYDNPFFGPHPGGNNPPERVALDPAAAKLDIDRNHYTCTAGGTLALYGVPWRNKSRKFQSIEQLRAATKFELSGTLTWR